MKCLYPIILILLFSAFLIAQTPQTAEEYFNRGTAHYNKADYNSAIADYTQAIRLKPDYASAYNRRGRLLDLIHAA
ncbi:MAG: tetratricopeptide repeat protein [Acidobacteria bacterium]|nr:tetratricopeptide repeat protein [Acidobacteriota bacterium]